MDDLISRQAAIDALNEVSEHYTDKGREWHPHVNFMVEAIEALPSAQRTGRWIVSDLPKGKMKYCSECGFGQYIADERQYRYCPNCGLPMKKEVGE